MGFRIIKERSAEYSASCKRLKKSELEKEMQRWAHLTTHSTEESHSICERMQAIMASEQKGFAEFDVKVKGMQDAITSNKINIANVQGNLEIARLADLIPEIPKNSI